ncbi:MAG TPA: hypothetical protein VF175_09595 [Lacipirellula sp.]
MEKVPTPEWADDGDADCFVYVKRMLPRERDAWEVSVSARGDGMSDEDAKVARMANFTASLCAATICNENGDLLFSQDEVKELGEGADGVALKRCYKAATKLNGMDEKELSELEKNSEPARDAS